MFTQVISQIIMAISLISTAPAPEVVNLPPDVKEQVLNIENLDEQIELYNEIKNECTRSGCSLASHK